MGSKLYTFANECISQSGGVRTGGFLKRKRKISEQQ